MWIVDICVLEFGHMGQTMDSIGYLDLSDMWLGVYLKMDTQKSHMLKRDWITCSNHANHSRFNNQRKLGGPTWLHMSIGVFTLLMHRIFIWVPNFLQQFGITPLFKFGALDKPLN